MVIHEADRLSFEAQQGLRRTMEKYSSACKLVLMVTHIHKFMEPVLSRCMCIRVPAPSEEEVGLCLGRLILDIFTRKLSTNHVMTCKNVQI